MRFFHAALSTLPFFLILPCAASAPVPEILTTSPQMSADLVDIAARTTTTITLEAPQSITHVDLIPAPTGSSSMHFVSLVPSPVETTALPADTTTITIQTTTYVATEYVSTVTMDVPSTTIAEPSSSSTLEATQTTTTAQPTSQIATQTTQQASSTTIAPSSTSTAMAATAPTTYGELIFPGSGYRGTVVVQMMATARPGGGTPLYGPDGKIIGFIPAG